MNLVEKDFEKYPSVESIRKAYHGLQFWFNDIGSFIELGSAVSADDGILSCLGNPPNAPTDDGISGVWVDTN